MPQFEPANQSPNFDILYQQYLARQKNTEDLLRVVGDNSGLEGDFESLEDVVAALVEQLPVAFGPVTLAGTSTSIITTIPSWARWVQLDWVNLSTNGSASPIVQIGPSSGVETAGYLGTGVRTGDAGNANEQFTNGFRIATDNTAAAVYQGGGLLRLHDSATNTWTFRGETGKSDSVGTRYFSGSIVLSGALTQITATTTGGVNTFDGGTLGGVYGY